MEEVSAFPVLEVEFDKDGHVSDGGQVQTALDRLARGDITDLFVFAHGWNNDMDEARALYRTFFERVRDQVGNGAVATAGRRFAVLAVLWPSKRFADSELIPGGAAGVGDTDAGLQIMLDELKTEPIRLGVVAPIDPAKQARLEEAKRLVPLLEHDANARLRFVGLVRSVLSPVQAHPEDGSDDFFTRDAEELMRALAEPVPTSALPDGGGGAAASSGAASGFLGDLGSGARSAARRFLNFTTYYQMKGRAGGVGSTGLADVLRRVHQRFPAVKLHLIGHSFGGRLVTAAADALGPQIKPDSLTLLQAAYSHNGFASRFDGKHDGFFRKVVTEGKIAGPILITCTRNDRAVGIAYPLVSRVAGENAAALGAADDPYGGIGRNGAVRTPEAERGLLLPAGGNYAFRAGALYNLNADAFIAGHNDVARPEVAYALLAAVATAWDGPSHGVPMGRAAVPPALNDPKRRAEWGLPGDEDTPGEYMVELNLFHRRGLEAADERFQRLYRTVVPGTSREPQRLAKTYYTCLISVREWRQLVAEDEQAPTSDGKPPTTKDRAIYRIWPDFPVKGMIDRSVSTVKADAAFRSYAASGAGITWAVIDSGIDASHPHFGLSAKDGSVDTARHTLRHEDVAQLHRDFTTDHSALLPPGGSGADRKQAAEKLSIEAALTDDFGHGTHVAGVIAGGLPDPPDPGVDCRIYERVFEASSDGTKEKEKVEERSQSVDAALLRGVAPRCKLVSLKVLDKEGKGRTSNLIRALEYIRDQVNGDPKVLRVHGVNLSVGYEFDAEMFACGQSPLCVEVDRLVQSGVVVVTAAGNTGYGIVGAQQRPTKVGLSNTINDPGNAAQAITVGATHRDAPHTYGVSYFSSKGPTGDGRLKPDLVAPGERITSCAAGEKRRYIQETLARMGKKFPGDGAGPRLAAYLDQSGTSMAAPHVSGAIAAFLSIRREFIGKPQEVKRIFLESATSLGRERYFEGRGLVDLMRAIQSV